VLRVLAEIPLFLTPFILYAGFLLFMKRDIKEREHWQYKRVLWLTITGVILVLISIAIFENKGHLGYEYRPATSINGEFKPAEWIKRP
jgi:hypothetical protein